MRPGVTELTDLAVGSCFIPVVIVADLPEARARDWHGYFSPDRWEICISASCPQALFIHVLAHEYKHAMQYLDGTWHTKEDDELEAECDRFALDFSQLYSMLVPSIAEIFAEQVQGMNSPAESEQPERSTSSS